VALRLRPAEQPCCRARSCERRAMNLVLADGAAINGACDRRSGFDAKLAIWRIALIASARRRQPPIGLAASQRIASARLALSDRPNDFELCRTHVRPRP
jgi:hypothetical protein